MEPTVSIYKQGIFWLLMLILAFSPLFRAGNLPIPLLLLELGSLSIIVMLLMRPSELSTLKTAHLLLIGGIFMLPLLALFSLPVSFLQVLPGRDVFFSIDQILGRPDETYWSSISLVPHKTEMALWALLPPLAVFAATVNQPNENVLKLVYLMFGMAVFQALLSLMQYGGGLGIDLTISNEWGLKAVAGTYLNRDHLAGFMEMVFPVLLALLAATVGKHRFDAHRGSRWRKRLDFLTTLKGHQTIIYAVIGVLVILCLIFTRSRAGIALTMLGLLLTLAVFARRLGGSNVYGTYGSVLAVILVLAIEIGLAPVLDRFSLDPMEDLRWDIYGTSIQGIVEHFPAGTGPGTYPDIYPQYQAADMDHFINRAHNDYLEWIFDGGALAVILILAGLIMYALGWRQLWIRGRWHTFRYVQAGAGIGAFLIILHSLLDYNLHKPANAIYFAFLLAVFVKSNDEEALAKQIKPRRIRTKRLKTPAVPESATRGPKNDISLTDW